MKSGGVLNDEKKGFLKALLSETSTPLQGQPYWKILRVVCAIKFGDIAELKDRKLHVADADLAWQTDRRSLSRAGSYPHAKPHL